MSEELTLGRLKRTDFQKAVDGKNVDLYILTNKNGLEMSVSNYGAKIVSLHVPDRNGKMVDVVLGHNTIDEYLSSKEPYFGAVCGRVANRIAKGIFRLCGVEYRLAVNNGPNHLHGGLKGFNAMVWTARQTNNQTIELTYVSPDGEESYPGELRAAVTMTVTKDNAFRISYLARAKGDTILNLTNHAYFNLDGAESGDIRGTVLTVNSDRFTALDAGFIPTGEIRSAEGTAFDFRAPKAIGRDIGQDDTQLKQAGGYDLNYILPPGGGFQFAAGAYSEKSGIKMDCWTDQPAIQLYTGNMLKSPKGKKGIPMYFRQGFCLETQHYPDSPNHPEFPSTVLRDGEVFESATEYRFSKV